jgi:hypothetical protein
MMRHVPPYDYPKRRRRLFLAQDILQPQAFDLPTFEQGHSVVPAELKESCWGELRRSDAFYNPYESYEAASRGRYIQDRQRMVLRIDQQHSILKSQVSFRVPGGVCSDGSKRAIRPGLHPPRPTVRVDNLLSWVSVSDAPRRRP